MANGIETGVSHEHWLAMKLKGQAEARWYRALQIDTRLCLMLHPTSEERSERSEPDITGSCFRGLIGSRIGDGLKLVESVNNNND